MGSLVLGVKRGNESHCDQVGLLRSEGVNGKLAVDRVTLRWKRQRKDTA